MFHSVVMVFVIDTIYNVILFFIVLDKIFFPFYRDFELSITKIEIRQLLIIDDIVHVPNWA